MNTLAPDWNRPAPKHRFFQNCEVRWFSKRVKSVFSGWSTSGAPHRFPGFGNCCCSVFFAATEKNDSKQTAISVLNTEIHKLVVPCVRSCIRSFQLCDSAVFNFSLYDVSDVFHHFISLIAFPVCLIYIFTTLIKKSTTLFPTQTPI